MFGWFKRKRQIVGYISWYQEPWRNGKRYLSKGLLKGDGFWYSQVKADAFVFPTEKEARARAPVYDGSDGFGDRTGVEPVWA